MIEVRQFFKAAFRDKPLGIALFFRKTAPHLGNQEAHIVVHAILGSDVTRRRGKAVVFREDVGHQRVV